MNTESQNRPADFEDYGTISSIYDKSRVPIGVSQIAQGFSHCTSSGHFLFDIGCGTGNYLYALQDQYTCAVGLDASSQMLKTTAKKGLKNVALMEGTMLDLPFEPDSFDLVMSNFAVHHIGLEQQQKDCQTFLSEAFRVLRKGGVFVLGTTLADQYDDGFWWSVFLPEAVNDVKNRLPVKSLNDGWFHDLADQVGFQVVDKQVNYDETLQSHSEYIDLQKYLNPSFYKAISTWALASSAEQERAVESIRQIANSSDSQAFIQQREERRLATGQSVFLTYKKA